MNPICHALADLKLDGNVIPNHWFSVIGEINRYGNFRADLLAINIMAELVYWYRPKLVRDEETGIERLEQKFHADKYQMSYGYMEKKFGCPKKAAKAACDLLVKLEAINREFRTIITKKSVVCNNVMFLEPEVLWVKSHTLPPNRDIPYPPIGRESTPQQGGTNTNTTSKTSTENNSASGNESPQPALPKQSEKEKIQYLVDELLSGNVLDEGWEKWEEKISVLLRQQGCSFSARQAQRLNQKNVRQDVRTDSSRVGRMVA